MPRNVLILVALFCVSCFSCKEDDSKLFSALDKDRTGISFQNTLYEDGPLNVSNYIYFYNGGGVAVGDINNDGLQDILFTGNMVKNRLYLNKGNFQFEDITPASGVADKQGWCTGATMVDINEDGLLDIYICRSADSRESMRRNLLFINNGNLTFTEKAEEFGLGDTGYSTQSAFFDYDNDGDLDCFVMNHSSQKYSGGVQDNIPLRKEFDPAFACKLYRNDNKKFVEISKEAGIISNVLTFGLGLAVSDYNNDGWQDIYVSNDFNEPDYLFVNNRNGTFSEKLAAAMDEISLFSMGSDAADYNNDGFIDLVTLDMLPEDNKTIKMHSGAENFDKFQYLFENGFYYQYSRNMLQKNNGDGTFSEVAQLAGVSNTDWSWTALFGDYDNDGFKDLYVSNGYVKDYTNMDFLKYSVDRIIRSMHKDSVDPVPVYISKMPTIRIPNYIFQNNGDETFSKRTTEWGFEKPGITAGSAYADFDNDGDLDLVMNNSNDFADIYKNNSDKIFKNNFLRVKLNGDALNPSGVGAKVTVYTKGQKFFQEQSPVRGFQSTSDQVLNFGLGKNEVIDSVQIIWPRHQYQVITGVKANQLLEVKFSDARNIWQYDTVVSNKKSILQTSEITAAKHSENTFNDFSVQTLLSNYLSREGPGIETADINKDGLTDFFIGGAKGGASKIFVQQQSGAFTEKPQSSFQKNNLSEDVTASFFDADNDGDPDLYIGSGGYEFEENDPLLQDRFYLNDGAGNFVLNENALPSMLTSTSCVEPADIDGDGDLDLFVGGRVVPGKYPTSPRSYILLNDGKGNFSDATAAVNATLQQPGMVTSAVWVNINNDKSPDLVIAGEWMPVMVFINNSGKLVNESAKYIPFASTGWWNSVAAADTDGDGDEDLLLGNCGLNTQFKVSDKEPMTLYYKDFDGNGRIDPIVCYYINGVSYPANSLDDIAEQLPFLKKKFLEYKIYAEAKLTDLFTPEQLKDAAILKAETMRSVMLINQDGQSFIEGKLPLQAQYSPVHNFIFSDLNNDGKKDILMTGNNTWTRIKYGRYSANHGLLFSGDGIGGFSYIQQNLSGLNIRGNVRGLGLIARSKDSVIVAGINNGSVLLISKNK
jgi:hypothetical protein